MSERERWASRVGLVLAMAGNAVRWFSRAVILLMLTAGLLMIRKAWERQDASVTAGPE